MSDSHNLIALDITPLTQTRPRRPKIEDWDKIWEAMEQGGLSLKKACIALNIHYPSARSAINLDPRLQSEYQMCNASKAEDLAEKVVALADGVLDGTYKVADVKAAMPAYQWAAAQLDPEAWGKSRVEVTGKNGKDLPASNVVVFELPRNGR